MAFVVGDTVKIACTFTVDGVATTPTTLELKVKDPSGNVDTYSSGFTIPSTGAYYKSVAVDEAGTWWTRWEGTGTAPGAEEASFVVVSSQVE